MRRLIEKEKPNQKKPNNSKHPAEDTGSVFDLLDYAFESESFIRPMEQLSTSFDALTNVDAARISLIQSGADEETITAALAPVAIKAIESVDEESVPEMEGIALEADGGKSFWLKVKEKIKAIYDAIVGYAKRFVEWLSGFFSRTKQDHTKNIAILKKEEAHIDELVKEAKDSKATPEKKADIEKKINAYLTMEALPQWAMNEEGWTGNEIIPRLQYYNKNVVQHAKNLVQHLREQTRIGEHMLSKLRQSSLGHAEEEVLEYWREEDEKAAGEYTGEDKFVGDKPLLIGFKRTSIGIEKNATATGVISFRDINQTKQFMEVLHQYGLSSLEAIKIMEQTKESIDKTLDVVKRVINEYQPNDQDISNGGMVKILGHVRNLMFKQINMLSKYSVSYSSQSQRNGVSLIQAMRLQEATR